MDPGEGWKPPLTPNSPACRLEAGAGAEARLQVLTDILEIGDRDEFSRACDELLKKPAERLIIDLGSLTRIYSLFIGILVDTALRARAAKKELVIRARGSVAESLRLMNVDGTAKLETTA